jgi:hypothetical protein
MDRLLDAKDNIMGIQAQLIEYLSAGEDTQDLTHLFTKLSVENPAAYELTLLMYQELHTKAKMDRKKITKVISQVLNQSALAYEKLIQHEVALKNHNIYNPNLGDTHHAPVAHAPNTKPKDTKDTKDAKDTKNSHAPAFTPQGIIAILLSPTVIYALLSTVVISIATLVLLSMHDRETYDLMVSIVKKLVGLNPITKE